MNEILHANIFFFITSLAVILLSILVAYALYYIVGILKNVREISERVNRGSVELEEDLKQLRSTIKQEGVKVTALYGFLRNFIESFIPKKKKKSAPVREVPREAKDEEPTETEPIAE